MALLPLWVALGLVAEMAQGEDVLSLEGGCWLLEDVSDAILM